MAKSGNKADKRRKTDLMQASDLGIRMALMMALFTYGGFKLDQWLDTQPAFLIVGAFFGLGGGMWTAVLSVNRLNAQIEAESSEPEPPEPPEPEEERDGPA